MIRRKDGTDWLLIAQPDHAAVCGQFAERWGSPDGNFGPVDPGGPVAVAAREHDNGWAEWEAAPTVDPGAARPRHFTEMPAAEFLGIWQRGVRRGADQDPHVGLLVSMHAGRLTRARLASPRDPPADRDPLRQFLQEQEAAQDVVRSRLGLDPQAVAAHSWLIATWDRLSLLLCCGPVPAATLAEVPARGRTRDIAVRPTGERSASLDPYPFAGGPVELAVPARRIPALPYTAPEALRAALGAAPVERLTFALHPVWH